MQKFIFILLFMAVLIFGPPLQSHAAALTQTQIFSILSLLQAFGADQSTVEKVRIALGGSVSVSAGGGGCAFSRSLTVGSQGDDVQCLQSFLKKVGFFSGDATGYFGPMTQSAVARWQATNGIIPAQGYFGEKSRFTADKQVKDLGAQSIEEARKKSRDHRRISDIKQIQLALELYFDANNAMYPENLDLLSGTFIPVVPVDPLGGAYAYRQLCEESGACTEYHLGAALEDQTHAALGSDADFDSTFFNSKFIGGFSGADDQGCRIGRAGSCYDVRP